MDSVGVVVIGRNEGERLVRCLRSLLVTRDTGFAKIVYVDSGSSDASVANARAAGASVVELDLAQPFTAARARNEGSTALLAHEPELRYVQFVDGDCELDPDWLARALAFLEEHDDVAVACGRRRERFPDASIYNRLCDIEWDTPLGEAAACGGDALVRISAFKAVGGFHAAMIAGEEPELCSRLRAAGWRVWRLDLAMTTHDAAMIRFSQWWMRGVRSGFGYAQVWNETRTRRQTLYRRELLRAAGWGAALPAAALLAVIVHPALGTAGLAVYPAQVARIAARMGMRGRLSWAYGGLMTLGKFAELQGAVRFFAKWRNRPRSTIEYKAA